MIFFFHISQRQLHRIRLMCCSNNITSHRPTLSYYMLNWVYNFEPFSGRRQYNSISFAVSYAQWSWSCSYPSWLKLPFKPIDFDNSNDNLIFCALDLTVLEERLQNAVKFMRRIQVKSSVSILLLKSGSWPRSFLNTHISHSKGIHRSYPFPPTKYSSFRLWRLLQVVSNLVIFLFF